MPENIGSPLYKRSKNEQLIQYGLPAFLSADDSSTPQEKEAFLAFARAFTNIEKSRLLITELGSLGVAFGAIQAKDVVALVTGLDKPLVLRPNGETYQLAGHGFIYGIMDGEAWLEDPSMVEDILLA